MSLSDLFLVSETVNSELFKNFLSSPMYSQTILIDAIEMSAIKLSSLSRNELKTVSVSSETLL